MLLELRNKNMKKDFENYLKDIFFQVANPTKETFEDEFNNWLLNKQPDDFIKLANMYALEKSIEDRNELNENK